MQNTPHAVFVVIMNIGKNRNVKCVYIRMIFDFVDKLYFFMMSKDKIESIMKAKLSRSLSWLTSDVAWKHVAVVINSFIGK